MSYPWLRDLKLASSQLMNNYSLFYNITFLTILLESQKVVVKFKLLFVMVLAGVELIFFTDAGMGLCYGFVRETVDNKGMFISQ